jgi:hypothetical protein
MRLLRDLLLALGLCLNKGSAASSPGGAADSSFENKAWTASVLQPAVNHRLLQQAVEDG